MPGEEPILHGSSISLVDGQKGLLAYRGFDLGEFARGARFESVAQLLILGEPPVSEPAEPLDSQLRRRRGLTPSLERLLGSLPDSLPPMEALRTLLSSLGEGRFGHPPTLEEGAELIARAPALVAASYRKSTGRRPIAPDPSLGHVADYLYQLTGEAPHDATVRALEGYCVALADHGVNSSTLALRIVISTGSDLASAAVAALGALKGPAHGGAPSKVAEMLDAVAEPELAGRWVEGALSRGERLPGFGHRVYTTVDPRAELLKALARPVADPKRFRLAEAVEAAGLEALRRRRPGQPLHTNVEFYAALLLESCGLPKELFTPTFAVARTAGWVAHALEQAEARRMILAEVPYDGRPIGRRWPFGGGAGGR